VANEVNLYTPRYLAEVVKVAPPMYTFFKDTFFTNVKTFATERVDIDLVKGDRHMAAFVHPKLGGTAMQESGYITRSYKPPLVNPYSITTADQLLQRLPGEDMYSGKTPAQRAAEKLVEEYNKMNDAATRREEWMAAQAIMTGGIHVLGEGVEETIDFILNNKETLTGTARWGQSAAKIRENLRAWKRKVQLNGFANVNMVVMGREAWDKFCTDKDIRETLDIRRYDYGVLGQERELPNGLTYHGHLNDPAVDIYEYNEVYLDDWTDPKNPKTLPLVPDNAVLMISSAARYMMAYGLCTYIEDQSQRWVTAQTPRLLRSYVAHRPDRRMVELQTRPLPIPDKVDSWQVATVL